MSSRRGSVGKSHAGASSRGGAVAAAATQAASHELEKLRAQLLESLTSTISDTVDTVCEEFEESFARAAQALPSAGASSNGASSASARGSKVNGANADYDLYYSCCKRLVSYIEANMETSPDFKQQMGRIILACHSNASDRVLSSVVTKRLWFHSREDAAEQDDEDAYAKREVYVETEDEEDDDDDDVVEIERTKPPRSKMKTSGVSAPSRGPAKETSRGTKRRAPPPPPPVAKSSRHSKVKAPDTKRVRREAAVRKVKYAPSEEEESDEDEEPVERKPARRQNRVQSSDEEDGGEEEEDEDDVVYVANEAKSQPHYGQGDELLNFKDAIGDMCYADRRTPAQTRFFKDRLRKAIQFVDSQLCKPPKGKVCKWECAKIRKQMCNRDLPCRNKICRLWHDVEAHTDRCQNAHCEFRIRVMLRETMYKIDHKKMELLHYRNELHEKKKKLLELKHENLSDRESYVEKRLLDNEIGQLEADVETADRDLGVYKATKKTYWVTLNEIGITIEDDVNDQFPDFNGHYVDRKAPVKKKTPTKARKTASNSTSTPASARPQRARRMSSSPSVGSALASPESGSKPPRERITRRSTTQSLQAMTNGVIELDDDDDDDNEEEETKTDRSVEEEEERLARAFQNGGLAGYNDDVTYVDGGPEDDQDATTATNDNGEDGNDPSGDAEMPEGDQPPQDQQEDEREDEAAPAETREAASAVSGEDDNEQSRNPVESSPSKPPRGEESANGSPAKGLFSSVRAMLSGTSALAAFNQAMNSPAAAPEVPVSSPVLVQARRPASADDAQSPAPASEDTAPLLPF